MEYERGWGSRIDDKEYFSTYEEAEMFIAEFNSKNTSPVVPDWYMIADGPHKLKG